MKPWIYGLLLFVFLVAFLPIYVLLGFVPTPVVLFAAVSWLSDGFTLWAVAPWIVAAIGIVLNAAIARALTRFVYRLKQPDRNMAGILLLAAPLIIGALPIYGFSAHGSIEWESMYSLYPEFLKEVTGRP